MTSLIAAGGSGRSTSVIPAVPAAWSVTTIAFMGTVSSIICLIDGMCWVDSPHSMAQATGGQVDLTYCLATARPALPAPKVG
jgi:hypothetical protein